MRRAFFLGIFAIVGLGAVLGVAQTTLPPNTVLGRLGVSPGPPQAIPFATLANELSVVGVQGPGISVPGQVATWVDTAGLHLASTPATLARSSATLNIDSATAFGDVNAAIAAADRAVYHTALSAARTDTLPAANTVNPGQTIFILDIRGVATASNTITLQRANFDTINGGTTFPAISAAYGSAECWSDGVSRWACQTFAAGGGGGGGSVSSVAIAAGTGISVSGTCTITSTGTCTITGIPVAPAGASGNVQYNNSGVPGGLTDTQLATRITPLNNTWAGKQHFGSGSPWVDVKAGGNGCPAAVGNGVTDDWTAIQCQANYLWGTFAGGVLFFPPGTYVVSATIQVNVGTYLQGSGAWATAIVTATDITAVAFTATVLNGGLDRLAVYGYQNAAATAGLVTIGDGALANLSNCYFSGGLWGLITSGVDGNVSNCTIQGWGPTGGAVFSRGANTYWNARLDQPHTPTKAAFYQDVAYSGGQMESRIVASDMSGIFDHSIILADTNEAAILHITNSVFSNQVTFQSGRALILIGNEFGDNVAIAGGRSTIIVGGYGFGSRTATGATCSGNINITC